jgi:Putative zinc-finger
MTDDPFIEFDGAYVLGALSADERDAFEAHLLECDDCRTRVDELAELADLLALVPADAYTAPNLSTDPVIALLATARARRRRRRWTAAVAATAAAACLVTATALITDHSTQHSAAAVAAPQATMTAVATSPIHATVAVASVAWGTSIKLTCTYDQAVTYPPDERYSLVVRSRSGQIENLGTWTLVADKVTTFPAGTALHKSDIESISVDTADGAPLLQLSY